MSTKLIVVLGATGNQGGSVADVFLNTSGWRVRAVTRNPGSAKAKALADRGAEVVSADMDVPSSLVAAFENAHAIFAVSDFWGLYGDPENRKKAAPGQPLNIWAGERETQQLKNVIDAAAKSPALERFVLSSLSNATKWSGGKYTHVYHFDSKAKAEEYAKVTYPDLWAKTSVYQAGLFLANFLAPTAMAIRVNEEGVVKIQTLDPEVKLPIIAAEEDSGPLVLALVQEPAGKNLIGYREWLNFREIAQAFAEATGKKTELAVLTEQQFFRPIPEELKSEMKDNFAYFTEFGYEGRNDPTILHPRQLKSPPQLPSVIEWFRKQDWSKMQKIQ